MNITCVTLRYLPNLRYIARLCEVDCVVALDLIRLPRQSKNSFVSRNRIRDKAGNLHWLSVPIRRKGIRNYTDAFIDKTNHNWINKHIGILAHTYPKHNEVAGDFLLQLRNTLAACDGRLLDLNLKTLNLILEYLELVNVKLVMQSSILESHSKKHRLEISKCLKATSYVAGHVEWNIMHESSCIEKMKASGIRVTRSPDLDPSIFPVNEIQNLSCVHSICTLGPKCTRALVGQMVHSLTT